MLVTLGPAPPHATSTMALAATAGVSRRRGRLAASAWKAR
jgi:hypothetical protein